MHIKTDLSDTERERSEKYCSWFVKLESVEFGDYLDNEIGSRKVKHPSFVLQL